MNYKILGVYATYDNDDNGLKELAVLWYLDGCMRCTYSTRGQSCGYKTLNSEDRISDSLLQEVARKGMELSESKRKKIFPFKEKSRDKKSGLER